MAWRDSFSDSAYCSISCRSPTKCNCLPDPFYCFRKAFMLFKQVPRYPRDSRSPERVENGLQVGLFGFRDSSLTFKCQPAEHIECRIISNNFAHLFIKTVDLFPI